MPQVTFVMIAGEWHWYLQDDYGNLVTQSVAKFDTYNKAVAGYEFAMQCLHLSNAA